MQQHITRLGARTGEEIVTGATPTAAPPRSVAPIPSAASIRHNQAHHTTSTPADIHGTSPRHSPTSEPQPFSPWQSQDSPHHRFGDRQGRRLNSTFSPPASRSASLERYNHYYHHHPPPASSPQDQLERLAAEASSVAGDISDSPPWSTTLSSPRSNSSLSGTIPGSSRDRVHHHPLSSVQESESVESTPTTPTAQSTASMSSTATVNQSRVIPRSSSIDSAISSVSAQSGVSHSHTSSSSSTNAFSQTTGTSSADIQSLILSAGSAEELIRYMLREKQSVTAQNSQLWRLVDKQRTMIVGLNKDLERAMKEKERYRNRLKEMMGTTPPSALTVAQSPSRTTESPAPSLDEVQSRVEPSSMTRRESVTSNASSAIVPSQHPNDATDMSSWRAGLQSIDNGSAPVDHYGHSPVPPGIANSSSERSGMGPLVVRIAEPQSPTSSQVISPISPTSQDKGVPSTPRRPGFYTSVSPPANLGRSPIRKAPPAPLELIASQLHKHTLEQSDAEDQEEGEKIPPRQGSKDDTSQGTNDGDDSRQPTPEDKIASTVSVTASGFFSDAPLSAPPTRSPPVPHFGPPMTPNPSSTEMFHGPVRDAADSPEKMQFMRVPGLPLSPRPADRPPNSPMPRGSRVFSLAEVARIGLPESPKPYIQAIPPFKAGDPRTSIPSPTDKPSTALPSTLPALSDAHERRGSESSTPATPVSAPIDPGSLLIQPSAISSIDSWVVSSRLKPSRISMLPGTPRTGTSDSVFTLGVFSRADGKEILRVEKDVGSLPALDEKLRKYVSYNAKVPDRSLFTGFAPARVDARRAAIDDFFAGVLGATMDERAALMLCEFFSTDVVEHWVGKNVSGGDGKDSPSATDSPTASRVVKDGYLTKRGKNFGGWKERYFILDGPILKYFDGPGGVQLGQIKLQNAQIGRQSASPKIKDDGGVDEDNQYRHAFLILEPKRKDSSTLVRHVLCAENDKERDEWVQCLLDYVHGDREDDVQKDVRRTKSDGNKETNPGGDGLRGMSYDQVSQGPPPARGPSPESLNRQQVSPSPSSLASQVSGQHSAHSPAPDRGSAKQISAPTNGAVISDLSAWGASKTAPSLHEDRKSEKAAKKRSIWGFRQRASSDMDDNLKAGAQSGHQQAAEKFPLSRAVFGASLEEAVYLTRPPGLDVALPAVVYRCLEYLEAKNASEEEGIFRLSGSNVVIKGLRERFNTESDFNLLANDEYYDVHAVSGLLKLYLRELPTNILTSERREGFVKVAEIEDKEKKIRALNELVHSLPTENFALLRALSGHLLRIVDNSAVNKMTIRNVGIVFSPTLNIPALVFSMFLHEYKSIFFRSGEAPAPTSPLTPAPPMTPMAALNSPLVPPTRPTMPSTPTMMPAHPAANRGGQPHASVAAYEPTYEFEPPSSGGIGQISAPRFNEPFSKARGVGGDNSLSGGGALAVPGSDSKSTKSRRRESSMMIMMGGMKKTSGMFSPSKSTAMSEEDLYG